MGRRKLLMCAEYSWSKAWIKEEEGVFDINLT